MKITTRSDQETRNFAKKFALTLRDGDIIALYGELGAGKTTFVKGLAEGLGIAEDITSPTFTLMNVYEIKKTRNQKNKKSKLRVTSYELRTLVHIDTYRLKDERELIAIGAEDYIGQPGVVTVVEWPEKIEGLLRGKKVTKIALKHTAESKRELTIA